MQTNPSHIEGPQSFVPFGRPAHLQLVLHQERADLLAPAGLGLAVDALRPTWWSGACVSGGC